MTAAVEESLSASSGSADPSAACMLCGAANWVRHLSDVPDYLTGDLFSIDRCGGCGLMTTVPMPSDAQIERYYPPSYRGNRHAFTGRLRVLLRCRALQRRFAPGFTGRLLDVGCGDGAFVMEMHRRGWHVCATEIDAATVDRLRKAGIDAKLPKEAEADGFGGEPFDAVTCWHVLEHVSRPAAAATWVRTQLRARGIFLATVPNAACLQARVFGAAWLHYDMPRHRYHFTPATFERLLTAAGFAIGGRDRFALEYDWFGVIQSALNLVCRRRNVLFDRLTCTPAGDCAGRAAPVWDQIVSLALSPWLTLGSLPLLAADWAAGDGASLTLVGRA